MVKHPKAVLISDVHYSVHTLQLATNSINASLQTANKLNVPLVVAGDLHDTKADLRAECVSAMLKTFKVATHRPIILIGNHDLINEKSSENSLEFLSHMCDLVSLSKFSIVLSAYLLPYHSNLDKLRNQLECIPKETLIIMHQGLQSSNSGHYFNDHSALSYSDVIDRRIISGHYHTRQRVPVGDGWYQFLGNPYTLNYGESGDPAKGYHILYNDNSLDFVPLNFRKHIQVEFKDIILGPLVYNEGDLVKVRFLAPTSVLAKTTKQKVADVLKITSFKLELIPTDRSPEHIQNITSLTKEQAFDKIIDAQDLSDFDKISLKSKWRLLI